MSFLGNVLWVILGGGILLFVEYVIAGFLLCVTIIGIPFGFQCIKISVLALVPFGKTVIDRNGVNGVLAVTMNVLWILIGGFWITITHLIFGVVCAITIIGIPFAKQHVKLAALALTPFGKSFE